MSSIVIFDFDNTMTKTDTTKIWLLAYGLCFPNFLVRLLAWTIYFERKSSSLKKKELYLKRAYENRTKQEIARVDKLFSFFLKWFCVRRKEVFDTMCAYLASGDRVVVLTASAQNSVIACMTEFPVDVIGTDFVVKNGYYTGEVDKFYCYGVHKRFFLKSYLVANNLAEGNIRVAWGDSISDLSVMLMAQERIWVVDDQHRTKIKNLDPKAKFHPL